MFIRDTWVEYAQKMAETGIDALELNFYTSEVDFETDGAALIKKQLEVLKDVKKVYPNSGYRKTKSISIPTSLSVISKDG
ncbi:MAG: hypothetical protein U5K54_25380 [Cytophagales bacterium]|nr:hypothetical protein [Cytophagales bacterium]